MERMIGDKYIEDEYTKTFNKYGAFFAFSMSQFNESKKDDIEYVLIKDFGGLVCPKDNARNMTDDIIKITEEGLKMNIEKHGINYIIDYELENYEAYYTRDYTDAYERSLSDYREITLEMVRDRYYENVNSGKYDDWI